MAASVGSLVAKLGLDASEYTNGLTKAEYQAQKFAQNFSNQVAVGVAKAEIAMKAFGEAVQFAARALPDLLEQAGHFQDIAEKTGASAEELASFAVAAKVAGSSIDDVAGASVKLTKNLLGVDDESKAAGAALAALGIPIEAFKQLDPAAQMETVAKALAGFADGADKTAIALALFGKTGAEILPFLKELAGDSGRQNILTKEQIRLADEYTDRVKRTQAQLNLYAQVISIEAIPALTAITDASKDFIKELLGISTAGKNLTADDTIKTWAENAAKALAFIVDAADGVTRAFEIAGKAIGAVAAAIAHPGDARAIYDALGTDIQKILQKPLYGTILDAKFVADRALAAQRAVEDRGFDPRKKLDFAGAIKPATGNKDKIDETDQYIKSLLKQETAMYDLTEVEKAEIEIYDLMAKGVLKAGDARIADIRNIATQIDYLKEAKKAEQERIKLEEEATRIRERNSQAVTRAIEAEQKQTEHVRQDNQQIEDQITLLRGGEEALRKVTAARLDDLIVKEKERRDALITGGSEGEAFEVNKTIAALERKKQLAGDLELAKEFAAEKKAAEDFANFMTDSFSNAFEGFIAGTKSARDAFRDFAKDIESYLIKLALHKVGDAIFGSNTAGGPDFFTMLAKLAAGFLGGGSSTGGGVPGVGFSGGGFGEHFAMGGVSAGGVASVGESGPERIELPFGAKVIPLHRRRGEGGGVSNVFNVNVMPGATTQSARQAAKVLAGAVMTSIRNP